MRRCTLLLHVLAVPALLTAPSCTPESNPAQDPGNKATAPKSPKDGMPPERKSEFPAPKSPKELVALLQDKDAKVRQKAGEELAAWFKSSRSSPSEREHRLGIVTSWMDARSEDGAITEEMVPVLIVALTDPDDEIRMTSSNLLREMGTKARAAIPAMAAALKDSRWEVRFDVANGLAEMGLEIPEALPPLAKAIGVPDPDVSWSATEALSGIRSKARPVLPILMEELRHSHAVVRTNALFVVGRIAPAEAEAFPAIKRLLKDEDSHVRASAVGVLGDLGDVRAVEPLIAALGDPVCDVRASAAYALGTLKAAEAIGALAKLLDPEMEKEERVRTTAAEALKKIRGEEPKP